MHTEISQQDERVDGMEGLIDFHAALKHIPLEVWITSEKGTEAKEAGHLKRQQNGE